MEWRLQIYFLNPSSPHEFILVCRFLSLKGLWEAAFGSAVNKKGNVYVTNRMYCFSRTFVLQICGQNT